ncbi:hypothetical protein DFP72DRAFT_917395 [Ephemerocybe angulata]|uniref:Uncharacterized protein n=1 Tax=Ephemerocybe angulata TaxID=980116 RepID=A0A8H6HKS9_9AGAR|nr:hypothetical protein DFP72DRAFT_917395 [Tulosesus angulatus]
MRTASPVKLRRQPKVHRTRACEWESSRRNEARDGADTFRLVAIYSGHPILSHTCELDAPQAKRQISANTAPIWKSTPARSAKTPPTPKPPATCDFRTLWALSAPNDARCRPRLNLRPHLSRPVQLPTTSDSSPPPTPDGQPSQNQGHGRTQPQQLQHETLGFVMLVVGCFGRRDGNTGLEAD